MSKRMFVIALIALLVSGCGVSRRVTTEQVRIERAECRDSSQVERVMVAVHDTVVETKIIHIQTNEAGDTLRVAQVTERDRIRDCAQVKNKEVEVRVVRDTVFIEKRDSVSATTNLTNPTSRASPVTSVLKWIFWIILALIGLSIILKIR